MQRDGAKESLWQHNIADYNSGKQEIGNKIFDVLIVGGGMTGITTARELQKAGRSCVVAEAHSLCFGTTGGTTAHLNSFFDSSFDQIKSDFGVESAQLLAEAGREALDLFKTNIEEGQIDCGYAAADGYVFSLDRKQTEKLEKMFEVSKEIDVDVSWTDRIPVPVEFEKAIVYRNQGRIHPSKYVYSLATQFEANGGLILQDCPVHGFTGDEVLEIETGKGTIKARHLIWATHIPPGINILHFRCAPYRSYAMACKLADDAYPEDLAYDLYDPYHYYRTQEVDGEKYLIGGGEDHKTAHEENTEDCFRKLESYLRQHFNISEVSFKWSSQYFEPADGLAYIGHLSGNPSNVFVSTGYGGNGMTYSHIGAMLLTSLIVEGNSKYEKLFSPGRIKPIAGFTNFVKENADVVKEFVGKLFSRDRLESLADLAHDEARVVKYEGKSIAIYKDATGKVHGINPTCTHAKCTVGWNTAEKSWDCPCHGARYSADGEVLTGPAIKGLEVVEIEELIGSSQDENDKEK